jgi:four helix bundle protein
MKNDLSDRFENWAVEVIKLTAKLSKTYVGRHIGGQLFRAATSAGANYEEACGGESRSDFIHKLQIVFKEMRESLYWLRLIMKSGLLSETAIAQIYKEGDELTKIVAKSVVTAKKNHP